MSKDTHDYTPHGGEHLMTANSGEGYEKLDDKIWPAPGSACTMSDLDDRQLAPVDMTAAKEAAKGKQQCA